MDRRGRQDETSGGAKRLLVVVLLIVAQPLMLRASELSPAEGIKRYAELVRLNPQSASYYNALGYYYFKGGHLVEAEDSYQKALEIDRSYAVSHNNIGILYLCQGKPKQAEAHFRQALAVLPTYVKAQYNLAVALFRQRRYVDAMKAYLVAREQDWKYVRERDDSEKMKAALEEANKDPKTRQELDRMGREYGSPN
jgi:Flp pilus assembly protein TadD